ncbi:hypothetical protein DD238_007841 [Peronospora effusa]|uniref:Uncharacterized protein n=1 Tax=Peronospora effusa TaxID=542832 RepID=A0A3M6VDA0_9STRA|nr:hypothetical protein DD238_007841 [Peronospora effusa]RQM16047.1 hypothetical protein DD237_002341 [Peronospora effusa]
MAVHLDAFDELVVGLQTTGDPVDESRQFVVLLISLPSEYELIGECEGHSAYRGEGESPEEIGEAAQEGGYGERISRVWKC